MQINIREAKNRRPELIRSVEAGKQVLIARRGEPVAQLVPVVRQVALAPGAGNASPIIAWLAEHPLPACLRAAQRQGDRPHGRAGASFVGLIQLDACLLIYLAERHPRWSDAVAKAMANAADAQFGISPLVKFECMVGPAKRGDPVLEGAYIDVFKLFVPLAMPDPGYPQAAQLRARFGLKSPDALHLACAQHHGGDALWTNDERLGQASHGLARMILKS